MSKIQKLKLDDILAIAAIIATFVLHSYTIILVVAQMVFSCKMICNVLLRKSKLKIYEFKYLVWWVMFTIVASLSWFWAKYTDTVLSSTASIIQVALLGFGLVVYLKDIKRIGFLENVMIWSAVLLCVRMLIVVPESAWGTERISQYVGLSNIGATYILSYVSLFSFKNYQKSKKLYYLIISIIITVFSLITGTKKAIIIAVAGIGLLMIFESKNKLEVAKKIILAFAVGVFVLWACMNIPILYSSVGVRFEEMVGFLSGTYEVVDKSTRDRMLFVSNAWEIFKEYPIIGAGLDNFRYINTVIEGFYSHNNYMEILSCLGLLGFLLYYWLPITLLFELIRGMMQGNKEIRYLFVIYCCILVLETTCVSYSDETVQTILAFIYSGTMVCKGNYRNKNKTDNNLLLIKD